MGIDETGTWGRVKLFTYSKLMSIPCRERRSVTLFKVDSVDSLSLPVNEFCRSKHLACCLKSKCALAQMVGSTGCISTATHREAENVECHYLYPLLVAYGYAITCLNPTAFTSRILILTESSQKICAKIMRRRGKLPQEKVTNAQPGKAGILNYKNTVIKGYSGKLQLTGPKLLDGGCRLGSKNSMGLVA